ncbi:response regulator transcription factor [Leucobacter luti]|uniref:Sensory transduction protein RegX3 n=1 Tax=Leucobacter luti TaxID=340320 RepID=A0A4R6S6X7_9MICO|nr:response regulator transcription factor [Leucobacter luti]MCW2288825.1 DNA-binding response OmpR family regulator [Leucobacter luti]QYM75274.1 response regulator transcription factor [Leucobacter luti]TCK45024.1 DNA-binding response OmpR family regulator [Leucobacter luti]TDP95550.1 DNA-binding response OmpR family regulator [Leucobacter luti]
MKILVIEDDDRVAAALCAFLRKSGFDTLRAADGAAGLACLDAEVDVVLLDLGLPDVDGIDLCRRIRARTGVPILIATARTDVQDRIQGLRAGADDFLVKPYDVRELVARIEAVTRRVRAMPQEGDHAAPIVVCGVTIDLVARQVSTAAGPIDLTPKEFDIVAVLARYPGVVVPRDRIIFEVWNTEWHAFQRSLEVHVGSIRRKTGRSELIETIRGVGYKLPVT